jgi:alpha-tubulin suppressor-like RCC1 family protein
MKTFLGAFGLHAFALSQLLFAGQPSSAVVWWGDNLGGQSTGTYSPGYSTGVVTTAGGVLSNTVAVAASYFHNLALRSDGTVVGWGSNHRGQAIGSESDDSHTNGLVRIGGVVLSNVVAIAAGNFSLALQSDGTVRAWGDNRVPVGLSNVVAIAARGFYGLALKTDGSVVSWGSQPWSQTHVPLGLSNVVSIAAGGQDYERSLALKKDGTVVAWGNESGYLDMQPPPGLTNVIAISAGYNHSLALKRDGTLVGWGFNDGGQATGVPATAKQYVSNGPVILGGQNLSDVVAMAAGNQYSLALKKDGTVILWGNKRFFREAPAGLTNVVAIAAGDGFCLAVTTNSDALRIKK